MSRFTMYLIGILVIVLLAGTALAAEEVPWRMYNVDDPAVSIQGRWLEVTDDSAFGRLEVTTTRSAAYAEFTFRGTGVRWIGSTGINRGKANVYLNDELVAEGVDSYRPEADYGVVLFELLDLEEGTYTLRVDPTGETHEGAVLANVNIDAFAYIPSIEGLLEEIEGLERDLHELGVAMDGEIEQLQRLFAPYYGVVLESMISVARDLIEETPQEIPEYRVGNVLTAFARPHVVEALTEAIEDAETARNVNLSVLQGLREGKEEFRSAIRPVFPDLSGTGNHGYFYGEALIIPGRMGPALLFDGRQVYIEVPDHETLDITEAITLEHWSWQPSDGHRGTDIWKGGGWSVDGYCQWHLTDTVMRVEFQDTYRGEKTMHDTDVPPDEWVHFATTWDIEEGEIHSYVNGEYSHSSSFKGPIGINVDPLFFGYNIDQDGEFLSGVVDEIRIWNYARSEEQVVANMNRQLDPETDDLEGLVGYWNFQEIIELVEEEPGENGEE